jgi:uncharacterized membrane protein YphA (DoxX/SURF4 family)
VVAPRLALWVHVLASLAGAFLVVAGFVMPSAKVVAVGGALVLVGGLFAFSSKRTLTPTGWASRSDLDAIDDPAHRAAAEKAVAWIVGSILVVVGGLILSMSLARALG